MEPQERDLITTLLTRLKSASGQPKDPEADALIRQAMTQIPDAPYYLVQTVLIQDLSLHNAQNRIAELERQVTEAQQQAARPTSFLGGLFGSPQPAAVPAAPAPPPPARPRGRGPAGAASWAAAWAAAGFCARRRRRPPGSPAARCSSRGSSRCSAAVAAGS